MRLQIVDLALIGGAHRTARTVDDGRRVADLLAAQFGEFAVTGFENPFQRAGFVAVIYRALI